MGQQWADAEAAARAAGYRLNDARQLAMVSAGPDGEVGIDGFYVLLPGDDQLIVGRDRERNVVGGLHLQGNVSQPKVYRTHRDPGRSFGLPVPDRAGRGTEGR